MRINTKELNVGFELSNAKHSLIAGRIFVVRGVQVMVDSDLASLYGVATKTFNQAVKRNIQRFPKEFRFQLKAEEFENLRSQFVTSSGSAVGHGGRRYLPYVFTEQGVAMLSGVLNSNMAIETSIRIMNAFISMRRYLLSNGQMLQQVEQIRRQQILDQNRNEERFDTVFTALATGNLLPDGILPSSSEFDSMRYVVRLVESAKSEILLIDPYSDAVTLEVLAKKRTGVKVRLVCKNRGQPTPTEIAKFNRQYKDLVVTYTDDFHDRFLVIDNAKLHGLGSSINLLGRRVSSYTTRDPKEITKLLALLP